MSSTLYVVAERRRLPAAAEVSGLATHAPLPELTAALEYAEAHAASGSAAESLADSLWTVSPAIAASARSLAFFFSAGSAMSARIESRVFSAVSFFSCADDDDGVDAPGDDGEHVVAATG